MSDSWQQFDLQSGGLQAANLRLIRRLRRRGRAYGLWLLFPLALHRDYLDAHRSAWLLRLASVAIAGALWAGALWAATVLGIAMLVFAAHDLVWIDRRVTARNKTLRREVYLSRSNPGAPAGFRGRGVEADTAAPGSVPDRAARAPSFAEQERLLRAIAARQRRRPSVD